jgi:hypothetical protein
LRNGTGNVKQRIDSGEASESQFNKSLCRFYPAQIKLANQWFSSRILYGIRNLF